MLNRLFLPSQAKAEVFLISNFCNHSSQMLSYRIVYICVRITYTFLYAHTYTQISEYIFSNTQIPPTGVAQNKFRNYIQVSHPTLSEFKQVTLVGSWCM